MCRAGRGLGAPDTLNITDNSEAGSTTLPQNSQHLPPGSLQSLRQQHRQRARVCILSASPRPPGKPLRILQDSIQYLLLEIFPSSHRKSAWSPLDAGRCTCLGSLCPLYYNYPSVRFWPYAVALHVQSACWGQAQCPDCDKRVRTDLQAPPVDCGEWRCWTSARVRPAGQEGAAFWKDRESPGWGRLWTAGQQERVTSRGFPG